MCGIAGIFNCSKSSQELRRIGEEMVVQLHHRGPDANGIKILPTNQGKNTLFAHTRLSIIDLSHGSDQPLTDNSGEYTIIFNGEIYNYQELRNQLKSLGAQFKTQGDTEVILEAYKAWGIEGFEKFYGMWAIALWDNKNQRLILSRDRLGIKPLYYFEKNGTLYFGSEPKVIAKYVPETRKLNKQAVSDYFSYRYVLGKGSFFQGISQLEPGTHFIVENNHSQVRRYWDVPVYSDKPPVSEKEAFEILDEALDLAVSLRMVSDVKVGSFLSGGLDSSILVSLMTKKHREAVKTFTIGFKEDGFNEFEYAQEVANFHKTEHKAFTLNAEKYLASLQTMIKVKDAPLAVPNEIALHELSKELKKDITVVLSGEGADELFGGYGRIFRSAFDYLRVKQLGVENLSDLLKANLLKKYQNLNFESELDHFLGQYSYLSFHKKSQILSPDLMRSLGDRPNNEDFFASYWQRLEGLDLHEKYMWIFQKVHLQGLLGRLDSATMSASVEGRVPFVDHNLIEKISALPLELKMKWIDNQAKKEAENLNSDQISEHYDITKYILRKHYTPHLPSSISRRKKVGFPVPLGQWLTGPLKDYAKERLLSPEAKTRDILNQDFISNTLQQKEYDHKTGLHFWMMVNLEDWMRAYEIET